MDMHPRNRFHRPRTITIALAATLLATVMGLSQCRMVGDPVTGVDMRAAAGYGDHKGGHGKKRSACEHECAHDYKQCVRSAEREYEAAKDDCRKLKHGERDKCRAAARRAHEAAEDACKLVKRQCKRDCRYQEGSGHGGR